MARNEDEVVPVTAVTFSPDRLLLAGGDSQCWLGIYYMDTGATNDTNCEMISANKGALMRLFFPRTACESGILRKTKARSSIPS